MPYTISHPAAAIPFKKFGLPLSGLVIGSIIPDFEFFLSMSDNRFIGHTVLGIFIFCIPVGFLLLLAFHKLLKYPFISLLPSNLQGRLLSNVCTFRFFPLSNIVKIILSLTIGIMSHLFLDAFTHYDGFFVEHIPLLKAQIVYFSFGTIKVYFLLQCFFSIVGLAVLYREYLHWYLNTEHKQIKPVQILSSKQKVSIVLLFLLFTYAVSMLTTIISITSSTEFSRLDLFKHFLSRSIITSCTCFLFALFVYSLGWHAIIPKHLRNCISTLN